MQTTNLQGLDNAIFIQMKMLPLLQGWSVIHFKNSKIGHKKKTLNPLHPNIKMHILLSDVYTFP